MATVEQADNVRKEAEKYMKTSFFGRRRPDYLNAAPLVEKAAVTYRAAGKLDSSVDLYGLASNAHYEAGGIYSAAQMLEKAGQITLSQKKGPLSEDPVIISWKTAVKLPDEKKPD